MSAPLLERLKSVLVYEESDIAPKAASIRQISVDSSTISTVVSSDFNASGDDDWVLYVLEALDGNVKGQLVLITGMSNLDNTATVTNFRVAPVGLTSCKMWDFNFRGGCIATSDSTTPNTITSSRLTQSDDYWNGFNILGLSGSSNPSMSTITDFVASTDSVVTDDYLANSQTGDAYLICKAIQPQGVEIDISGGSVIERDIITDTLAQEGIIVGTQDDVSININPEVRGLPSAAGSGVSAVEPSEVKHLMNKVMDVRLNTGGTVGSVTNATSFAVSSSSIGKYSMSLLNGDMFVHTGASDASTVETLNGHLGSQPANGDIVYGAATYSPKDSGHESVGFACICGNSELALISGCMPSVSVSLDGNQIARYGFNYMSGGALWAPYAKTHDDIYDTSAPVAVKSNVSRVVIDGVELDADVMTASAELLPSPNPKSGNFGAFEGKGGYFYTGRNPAISMTIYFEDSSYYHMFRSRKEFDLLIQVGTTPTNAWALWAPRAQLVDTPSIGAEGELMTQELSFRLLRPTTPGMPDFLIGHA